MADASDTTRVDPQGDSKIPLFDGFSTKIALALDPNICFWEKEVTPPSYDIGEKIDTTTMFNSAYMTAALQTLIENGEAQIVASYDPAVFDQMVSVVASQGAEGNAWTITLPDGTTGSFWGGIRSITPQNNVKGTQPTANIVFIVTNWDSTNKQEAGPAWTQVTGT